MAVAKVRIEFDPESDHAVVFEKTVEFSGLREPGGKEFVAQNALAELEKESHFGKYFEVMPSLDRFTREVQLSFGLEDLVNGVHDDRVNTREVWYELSHILHRVRYQLAQSRACHDQEQIHQSGDDNLKDFAWHFHLDKMERFYLAAIFLGKISDAVSRLIFERLGASLIPNLDRTNPEWERQINLKNVRKGLNDRTGNPHVAALTDTEYDALLEILDDLLDSDEGARLWQYRLRLVHRITPSVDRADLYSHLQSRERTPITDPTGKFSGWQGGLTVAKPTGEFAFLDLYNDAVETLKHHVGMLERLDAIAPFSVDAAAFQVSV